jgi:hypothetical protein
LEKRTISLINGAGKTVHPYEERCTQNKNKAKRIKGLKLTPETEILQNKNLKGNPHSAMQ